MAKLKLIAFLCLAAIFCDVVLSKPAREKRFSGINKFGKLDDEYGTSDDYIDTNELEEGDAENFDRDERSTPTTTQLYPDHALWWYVTAEPDSENDILPTTTTTIEDYEYEAETIKPEKPVVQTVEDNNNGEAFHKKVVPWFKRQWGHTRNFFKKHFNNIAG